MTSDVCVVCDVCVCVRDDIVRDQSDQKKMGNGGIIRENCVAILWPYRDVVMLNW